MKLFFYFLIFASLQGCVQKSSINMENLIGNWEGEHAGNVVYLSISKDKFIIDYSWFNKTSRYEWKYAIIGQDTLELFNIQQKESHIISKLTKKELKLRPLKDNQVNIPLIDVIKFKKLNN